MSLSPAPAATLVADAIARIGARRDTLDDLAAKGIEMVEQLVAGEPVEFAGRKPFTDPARAFAVISRAVRLCLALASRLDAEIIALLRGGLVPEFAILAPKTSAAEAAAAIAPTASDPRDRIARAVDAVIDAEAGDGKDAERLRDEVRERLTEGEDYNALLHQPWRLVVETICADLGLHPDWSFWDDKDGFRRPPALGAPPPPPMIAKPLEQSGAERRNPAALLPLRPD